MIALAALLMLLPLGLIWPGALMAGLFFGFPVSALSDVSITPIYTAAASLVAVVAYFRRRRTLSVNILDLVYFLFLSWMSLTVLWAPQPQLAQSYLTSFLLPAVSVYLISKLCGALGPDRLREFLVALCAMAAITGPMFYLMGQSTGSGRFALDDNNMVAVGMTQAYVTSAIAGLALFMWPEGDRLGIRLLAVAGLGASLLAVNLSGTRGGLIGISAGFLAFLALNGWFDFIRRMGLVTFAISLVVIGLAVSQIDWDALSQSRLFRFDSYGSAADASSQERYLRYALGLEMLYEQPILGNGLSSFGTLTGLGYPHNIILEVLSEGGLIGAAVFLCLLATVFRYAARVHRAYDSAIVTGVLSIIFAGVVHHQVSFNIPMAKQIFICGVLSGLPLLRRYDVAAPDSRIRVPREMPT